MPETTPLLSSPDGSNYYFLNSEGDVKRDADGGATVEGIPDGANAAEFEPKKLGPKRQVGRPEIPYSARKRPQIMVSYGISLDHLVLPTTNHPHDENALLSLFLSSWTALLFGSWCKQVASQPEQNDRPSFFSQLLSKMKSEPKKAPSMLKQRKAPIKVEPKVFFANERTFLAWMHISIILAGASIAILAFSSSSENPGSQLYGVVMLPVAIAFIIYSMYQCEYE